MRQLKANVVSANRQAWINGLRDDVAEVLSLIEGFDLHVRAVVPTIEGSAAVAQQRFDYKRMAVLALYRIRLRVNETEADAKDLVGFLQVAVGTMKMDDRMREFILNAAQRILKAEWERVKRLE